MKWTGEPLLCSFISVTTSSCGTKQLGIRARWVMAKPTGRTVLPTGETDGRGETLRVGSGAGLRSHRREREMSHTLSRPGLIRVRQFPSTQRSVWLRGCLLPRGVSELDKPGRESWCSGPSLSGHDEPAGLPLGAESSDVKEHEAAGQVRPASCRHPSPTCGRVRWKPRRVGTMLARSATLGMDRCRPSGATGWQALAGAPGHRKPGSSMRRRRSVINRRSAQLMTPFCGQPPGAPSPSALALEPVRMLDHERGAATGAPAREPHRTPLDSLATDG